MTRAVVAIITHSRPKGLERLLSALSHQSVGEEHDVQVLVVDNACDPGIRAMIEEIAQTFPFRLSYGDEAERGIVAARNRCIDIFLESEAECLLFIDDDEWPARNDWIQTMLDKRTEFDVDIVMGQVQSMSGEGSPAWANTIINDLGSLTDGRIVKTFYTGNLLISRPVLEHVRPAFDSRFATIGGSDYHFSVKCAKAGFRTAFADAPVEEEFPRSRANVKWFMLRGYRSGIAYTRAHMIEDGPFIALMKSGLMSAARFARGLGYITIGALTMSKARVVNGLFRMASSWGTVTGYFGAAYQEYNVIHGR